MNTIAITGNTYPVKEKLKAIGAKWNADIKAWMVAPEKQDEAKKIVESVGPIKPRATGFRSRYSSNYASAGRRCPNCGSRSCDGAWGNLCDED